jgi:hypothetical protein
MHPNLHLAFDATLQNQIIVIAWITLTVYALLVIEMDSFDGTRQQVDFGGIESLKQSDTLKRTFDL